jgi:photosystem II stability/assembly factor-like uncharacterized protein
MYRTPPSLLAAIAAAISLLLPVFAQAAAGWENVGPPLRNADAVEVAGVGGEVFFTIANDGYWTRSADGGATWTNLPRDTGINFLVPVRGQTAIYARDLSQGRLWFSGDAGATWEQIPWPTLPPGYDYRFSAAGPQPGVVYGVSRMLSGSFVGGGALVASTAIRSTDGLRTWSTIAPALNDKVEYITAAPSDVTTAYAWALDGLYRTRDSGATWVPVWSKAERGSVISTQVDSRDPLLVYVMSNDTALWVTEDGGDHWRAATAQMPPACYLGALLPDPFDSHRAFVFSGSGDIFETRDAGLTWTQQAVSSQESRLSPRLWVKDGRRSVIAADWYKGVVSLDLSNPHPIALGTDLWWNPAQPGWGLSIVQHDNLQVFAVWFTYDERGRPTWRFVPGGTWADSTTFTGALYVATVPARDFFASTFTAPTVTQVGTATLRFDSADSGEAMFTVGATQLRQPITRMEFGPVGKTATGLADLWFNPSQSGWGLAMHQQYSTLFATWFLYNDDGSPTWLLMPDATAQDGYMSGDVYRATGSAGALFVARGVAVSKVGTASVTWQTDSQVLRATIDGRSWASPVSRLPF